MSLKLNELELFKDISDQEIQQLVNCSGAFIKKYKEGQYIFRHDKKPYYTYILLSGSVVMLKDYSSGKQDVILEVHEGQILGVIFFNNKMDEYWFDAKAATDVELLQIPFDFFYGFCSKACKCHQNVTKNMLQILSYRSYTLTRKAHLLSNNNLRERIAIWIFIEEQKGEVRLFMNREQLASYLGTTRPSLSRELMKMQKDGLIEVTKDRIKILDREALEMV